MNIITDITITSIRIEFMADFCSELKLIQAFDPLFPIGSFTLSNGLETYVQKGIVHNRATLEMYLDSFLAVLPYNDLGFASFTFRTKNYILADAICAASKSPRELREASQKLCSRFIKIESALNENEKNEIPYILKYENAIELGECFGAYPVSIGLFILDSKCDLETAISLYAYKELSAICNNAAKLIPLGQTDAQIALKKSAEKISLAVKKSLLVEEDDLGVSGTGFDLRSMQHEKLYSRLYIS